MLITEGLAELKTLAKRIEKKREAIDEPSAAVDAALPVQEMEELVAKALDLKERMRVNRHEVHGGCCDDTPDHAVPCASPVCAIEYEAEVLLGQLATALKVSASRTTGVMP